MNCFLTHSSQKKKPELEQEQSQKQEQLNLKNSKIPSLNEFIEYAKSLEGNEPELELSISEKYESWKNNGWKKPPIVLSAIGSLH